MLSPKQWNRGGGQQIMSSGVSRIAPPTYWALLIRFLFMFVSGELDGRMHLVFWCLLTYGTAWQLWESQSFLLGT